MAGIKKDACVVAKWAKLQTNGKLAAHGISLGGAAAAHIAK